MINITLIILIAFCLAFVITLASILHNLSNRVSATERKNNVRNLNEVNNHEKIDLLTDYYIELSGKVEDLEQAIDELQFGKEPEISEPEQIEELATDEESLNEQDINEKNTDVANQLLTYLSFLVRNEIAYRRSFMAEEPDRMKDLANGILPAIKNDVIFKPLDYYLNILSNFEHFHLFEMDKIFGEDKDHPEYKILFACLRLSAGRTVAISADLAQFVYFARVAYGKRTGKVLKHNYSFRYFGLGKEVPFIKKNLNRSVSAGLNSEAKIKKAMNLCEQYKKSLL